MMALLKFAAPLTLATLSLSLPSCLPAPAATVTRQATRADTAPTLTIEAAGWTRQLPVVHPPKSPWSGVVAAIDTCAGAVIYHVHPVTGLVMYGAHRTSCPEPMSFFGVDTLGPGDTVRVDGRTYRYLRTTHTRVGASLNGPGDDHPDADISLQTSLSGDLVILQLFEEAAA